MQLFTSKTSQLITGSAAFGSPADGPCVAGAVGQSDRGAHQHHLARRAKRANVGLPLWRRGQQRRDLRGRQPGGADGRDGLVADRDHGALCGHRHGLEHQPHDQPDQQADVRHNDHSEQRADVAHHRRSVGRRPRQRRNGHCEPGAYRSGSHLAHRGSDHHVDAAGAGAARAVVRD